MMYQIIVAIENKLEMIAGRFLAMIASITLFSAGII